ncbi:hypothetical protein [Pseudarthrobacter sp. PvP090]|uniref:hypothetical protein n=1 Tax=Pseudarthrobacter sp. PvP090 TaxID=3156393 RepID=UPI0033936FDC
MSQRTGSRTDLVMGTCCAVLLPGPRCYLGWMERSLVRPTSGKELAYIVLWIIIPKAK